VLWGRRWQRGVPQRVGRALSPPLRLVRVAGVALAIGLVPLETALLLEGSSYLSHAPPPGASPDPPTVVSAVGVEEPAVVPAALARARVGPLLGGAPLLALGFVSLILGVRARRLRREGQRLHSALHLPAAAGEARLPWAVVLERASDHDLLQAWLLTEPRTALAVHRRWLGARLRQWPLTLACGTRPELARQLVHDGADQGAHARVVYGWRSTSPRRLRDASGLELATAALLHASVALGAGGLLLAAGAAVQHLLLIPPLLFLLGLSLARQLPRPCLLRQRAGVELPRA
jgi:hypothetical protein